MKPAKPKREPKPKRRPAVISEGDDTPDSDTPDPSIPKPHELPGFVQPPAVLRRR